ncbi:MAG: tRNA (5-methylaminomethyl-2-thiouridine)(34)-methyltransferase MnmD [Balneolales bacterium]|nr:tRNA (5-methylaminomethyl-2-thiouridine)(34)-methyltransferase MnmD [Balneolales bacterium]
MPRLEACRDGSHTVYSEEFGQFYHNPNGAVAESIHVFFEASGILKVMEAGLPINVLETGFGTGLNALLLADYKLALGSSSTILFQSVEAYPISNEVARELNYGSFLEHPQLAAHLVPIFERLQHDSIEYQIIPGMKLQVFMGKMEDMVLPEGVFDFVFHDPFSPDVNPELWSNNVFKRLYATCKSDATMVTYCAATKARGAMAVGGWLVARAPGALGKREMTIASKQEDKLNAYQRLNEARLIERFS